MTNGLLGKKLGMTQMLDETRLTPVTVIEAGPCRVVMIKTKERDGYEAVQLAFGEVKDRKLSKAQLGHLKKHEAPATRILKEFKKDGEVAVYRSAGAQPERIPVTGGFAEVSERGLTVLAESAGETAAA